MPFFLEFRSEPYTEGTDLILKVLDYIVTNSFGCILYCGCFNLYCGSFNLCCNVWVCVCIGFVMCGCFGSLCSCI